jgi:hypothetical protein
LVADKYNNSHTFQIMDSSYYHVLYWLPHVIIDMPTFQIHFMSTPHACGLLGVLNLLYSQCCGIVIQRLNYSYRHQWNGALHCGHLLLATLKVIMHYKWYMCWQVPKIHAPSNTNGEQQISHSSPFVWKVELWAKKAPLFFLTWQWHILNWAQDASPNLCLHSLPSWVNCQKTFQISWCQPMWSKPPIFTIFHLHSYELHLHLHSSKCCQNACKMHVVQIPFNHFHKRFNISSKLFFHINQSLMVAFNVFHGILAFFFHLSGPCECLL